jgi:hypothetical protein
MTPMATTGTPFRSDAVVRAPNGVELTGRATKWVRQAAGGTKSKGVKHFSSGRRRRRRRRRRDDHRVKVQHTKVWEGKGLCVSSIVKIVDMPIFSVRFWGTSTFFKVLAQIWDLLGTIFAAPTFKRWLFQSFRHYKESVILGIRAYCPIILLPVVYCYG